MLWFEYDLYDQVQILQILDWFSETSSVQTNLSIICTENYLVMMTAAEMKHLVGYEEPVSQQHLALAKKPGLRSVQQIRKDGRIS